MSALPPETGSPNVRRKASALGIHTFNVHMDIQTRAMAGGIKGVTLNTVSDF
jgi:hypothetical protein